MPAILEESHKLLALDTHSLVVPGENVLYVLNRQGAFDVKGKNVHLLHRRLEPYLGGRYGERELLSAVPSSRAGGVRTYLARLRDIGLLRDDPPASGSRGEEPIGRLGATRPRASLRLGGRRIEVSLDGATAAPAGASRLFFLGPEEAGRWLLTLAGPERPLGRTVGVVVEPAPEGSPTPDELNRRAVYARWLLQRETALAGREKCLELYRLHGDSGALRRIAVVDRRDRPFSALADQLEVIRSADVDQVPLVVATASHPFFPSVMTRFGLSYPEVHGDLLRGLLVRSRLAALGPRERSRFFCGELAAPLDSYVAESVAWDRGVRLEIAASRPELEAALLDRAAERRALAARRLAWRKVDLLTEPEATAEIVCLRRILRLRAPSLPARTAKIPGGGVLITAGRHRAASLRAARAVAEILLTAVWERFYAAESETVAPAAPTPSFSQPVREGEPRRRAETLRREIGPLRVGVRRIRVWGNTAWAGVLLSSRTPGSVR